MNEQPNLPRDDADADLSTRARAFVYPPTPDLAPRVRRQLDQERSRQRQHGWAPRRVAVAVVTIALVLSAALLLTLPDAQALARAIFRLGAVEIVVGTPLPQPTVTLVPRWQPNLVGRTTLEAAPRQAGMPVRLPHYPSDLGAPDDVYVQDQGGKAVILVWLDRQQPDRARLSLYELSSGILIQKLLPSTAILQKTSVNGQVALWVNAPHTAAYRSSSGTTTYEARWLVAGNALIWTQGSITYRLETTLPLDEARTIAESVR